MDLKIEDRLFVNCFRLELNDRLRYIEKEYGETFNIKFKVNEIYDGENLTSYRLILNDKLKYIIKIKNDFSMELLRDYDLYFYNNVHENLRMLSEKLNLNRNLDERMYRPKKYNLKFPKFYFVEDKKPMEKFKELIDEINKNSLIEKIFEIEKILVGKIPNKNDNQLSLKLTPFMVITHDKKGETVFVRKIMD